MRYQSAVAASGNTGEVKLPTTVFPFILRSVALLGIDSVRTPIFRRREVWTRLSDDLRPVIVNDGATEVIGLDEVPDALQRILGGDNRGRTVVRVRS
ncbi:hypothetical protein [Gordonia sp. OPL2]|uniref:hypothetical protein n=1 Tax=Gordonia sp. OPL2 TaxID=2486274 RepID=UPI0021CC5D19|nr:hypothetical protein [Gordonia sp. OPL2]